MFDSQTSMCAPATANTPTEKGCGHSQDCTDASLTGSAPSRDTLLTGYAWLHTLGTMSSTHTWPVLARQTLQPHHCIILPLPFQLSHLIVKQSDLLLELSVPALVFDWFGGPDSITPDVLSQQTPPPTPLVFRHSLLQFWPCSNVNDWIIAMDYKQLYDKVCETGIPNYLEARVPVPSGLIIPSWRTLMLSFPDTDLVDLLEFGWLIDYTSSAVPVPTFKKSLQR